MAGPVTHIFLALQVMSLLPPTLDKQAFIVGTTFPDIRYLASITRAKTHIEPVSWEDVLNEPSSFRAGMLFHNLVDKVRQQEFEPYFTDCHVFEHASPLYKRLYGILLKTAEDAFFYTKADCWSEIATYFDTVYQEELDFGIDRTVIREWHDRIKTYITQIPSAKTIAAFVSTNVDVYQDPMFNPEAEFDAIMQSDFFRQKIATFYRNFVCYVLEYNMQTTARDCRCNLSEFFDDAYAR